MMLSLVGIHSGTSLGPIPTSESMRLLKEISSVTAVQYL